MRWLVLPLVASLLLACQPAVTGQEPVAPATPAPQEAPESYVELVVGGVMTNGEGHAVILIDRVREIAVPILVGETEALAIALRHNRQRAERPLTHDLLDDVLARLGGELVKIQIDDIRGDVFVGAIFVRHEGAVISLDARPSDAIALALGHRAPIFVHQRVLARAGIRRPAGGDDAAPSSI